MIYEVWYKNGVDLDYFGSREAAEMYLEKYIRKIGGTLYRTKVGDRYIVERMLNSNSVFGGEPSGHIILKNYSTTGDGILAALKLIECVKFYEKPLGELAEEVVLVPQVLKNIKVFL